MSWKENSLVFWNVEGELQKVSDHNRSPLREEIERIENKKRMADGTLRRYSVVKKRTYSLDWSMLPSTNSVVGGMTTADGGMAGEDLERIHNNYNTPFRMVLRRGSAKGLTTPVVADAALPFDDGNFYMVNVMISDFSKEVMKRGRVDLWNVSITLEEV
jgi:hypothetical protein